MFKKSVCRVTFIICTVLLSCIRVCMCVLCLLRKREKTDAWDRSWCFNICPSCICWTHLVLDNLIIYLSHLALTSCLPPQEFSPASAFQTQTSQSSACLPCLPAPSKRNHREGTCPQSPRSLSEWRIQWFSVWPPKVWPVFPLLGPVNIINYLFNDSRLLICWPYIPK